MENVVTPRFSETEKEPKMVKLSNGLYKANYDELFEYFRSFIPDSVYLRETDGYTTITESELATMRAKRKKHADFEAKLFKCVELNNKGIKLEKDGEIDAAISVYEQNIEGDCYPAQHSFDRLLVLYRKAKNYADEKRVCIKAIKVCKDDKYNKRLEKINALIEKNSTH